jgi:hypothetical protein
MRSNSDGLTSRPNNIHIPPAQRPRPAQDETGDESISGGEGESSNVCSPSMNPLMIPSVKYYETYN